MWRLLHMCPKDFVKSSRKSKKSETISALYKARWQVESFFKTIKQHLRIKTFIGTNKNAVMCQIWTAMIAILLLQHLKNRTADGWHMSNLVTFIRIHLMSYMDLWTWINQLHILLQN